MNKLKKGYLISSAAYSIPSKIIKGYTKIDKKPEIGDLVYGEIKSIGQYNNLENKNGRVHTIHIGSRAIFVFGNRYAPDYYEGLIPEFIDGEIDLLSKAGVVGKVISKSSKVISPTKVDILGCACDEKGKILNTKDYNLIIPKAVEKKFPRSKLILVVGTAMNSGKSAAAVACIRSLKIMGKEVRASKVTGTARLKDILSMNDAGANNYSDFSFLGYPSTYKISEVDLFKIFNSLDLKFANNKDNYWVVEFADGINQRETALLLESEDVKKRINKLIFCAADAFGAIGGLEVLKNRFNLVPDAISGICSSSPLHIKELSSYTDIPVFDSMTPNHDSISNILFSESKIKKKLSLII